MKRKYVVPILIVLFIGWLIFSMTGTEQEGSAKLDAYIAKAKEVTNESQSVRMQQQDLIDQIKDGEVSKEEAKEKNQELWDKQKELVDKLVNLDTPEEIPGPASFLKNSLEERVTAAEKTEEYIETGEEKLYNDVKEHLIRSQGGIMSAFRRIEDYKLILNRKN